MSNRKQIRKGVLKRYHHCTMGGLYFSTDKAVYNTVQVFDPKYHRWHHVRSSYSHAEFLPIAIDFIINKSTEGK